MSQQPVVTKQDDINFQSDVLVDMGWSFFQRDGRFYSRAKLGSQTQDCPQGHDTQEGAVMCAFGFAMEVARNVPAFALLLQMLMDKHAEKFLREQRELAEAKLASADKPNWMRKMMGGSPG